MRFSPVDQHAARPPCTVQSLLAASSTPTFALPSSSLLQRQIKSTDVAVSFPAPGALYVLNQHWECAPSTLTIKTTRDEPYHLEVVAFSTGRNKEGQDVLFDLGMLSGREQKWRSNIKAGQRFVVQLTDADGRVAFSRVMWVEEARFGVGCSNLHLGEADVEGDQERYGCEGP
ncbi:hypothetical protein JCM8547_007593 [Rhodosporidiobolus lusitaniae]